MSGVYVDEHRLDHGDGHHDFVLRTEHRFILTIEYLSRVACAGGDMHDQRSIPAAECRIIKRYATSRFECSKFPFNSCPKRYRSSSVVDDLSAEHEFRRRSSRRDESGCYRDDQEHGNRPCNYIDDNDRFPVC